MPQYTLLCTSCGRPDLLERTFASFLATARPGPQYIVVVDDAGMEKPDWFPRHNTKWISNPSRRGQIYCADVLWDNCKTDYAFWLEDDWEFTNGGFIEQSLDLLETEWNKDILLVQIPGDNPQPLKFDASRGIYLAERDWSGGWSGFTFNPGMRRLADYRRIGSYGRHTGYDPRGCGELALSKLYRSHEYYAARLQGQQYCKHIGDDRHIDRSLAPRERILVGIPSAKSLNYGPFRKMQERVWQRTWVNGCSGLQIDGPNQRVESVLDTWFQDFYNHTNVEAKIFYGDKGSDTAQEVFLDCPNDHMTLSYKIKAMCQWAVDHDFQWLAKPDDDTFVYTDRLIRQFLDQVADRCDYAGSDEGGFAMGGRLYWLSRKAMELVAAADPAQYTYYATDLGEKLRKALPPDLVEWRDDAFVGAVMKQNGIKLKDLMGLVTMGHAEYPGIPTVTLHPVSPEKMRLMYADLGRQ